MLQVPVDVSHASQVTWITPEQADEWDRFVAGHPLGLVYHTSAWQRVLESAFPHIRGRFLALRGEDGSIRAGMPVYNVRSWLLKNRTVSVPFATVCDPLTGSREDSERLWPALLEMAHQNHSRRIEIRTYRHDADSLPEGMVPGRSYMHHYLTLDKTVEELLRSFHDSCVRRRMKKAVAAGVVPEEAHGEEALRAFYEVMVSTRMRLQLPPMPFAFFQAMFRHMVPGLGSIYLSRREGKVLGGILVFKYKGMWMSEYSGHVEDAPPGSDQLLYWHAIQQAKAAGACIFSFGRTSPDNEPLAVYKRRWGTVEDLLVDYFYYPGAIQKLGRAHSSAAPRPLPATVYSLARLMQHLPPNLQRTIGNFCYRHLG